MNKDGHPVSMWEYARQGAVTLPLFLATAVIPADVRAQSIQVEPAPNIPGYQFVPAKLP